MKIVYDISKYTPEEAYIKINSLLDGLVSQYSNMISNPTKKWNDEKNKMDFGFDVSEFNIHGNIKLQGKELIVNGKLPWIARIYNGKVKDIVKEQLEELFP